MQRQDRTQRKDSTQPQGHSRGLERSPWWASQLWSIVLGCLALGTSPGCESAPAGPERQPVAGRVTLDGAPVRQARIRFENDTGSLSTWAELDADGRYDIRTLEGRGLPAGSYKVTLIPLQAAVTLPDGTPLLAGMEGASNKEPDHPQIARKYTDPATSGLSIEVRPGSSQAFDFVLEK